MQTYLHSAMGAAHISFDTVCREQSAAAAASGFTYSRVRLRMPLPQVTEQGLQSVYGVKRHSAAIINLGLCYERYRKINVNTYV